MTKLEDYIQGKRHGEEANRLEREAIDDSFLHDAIDGFDALESDHLLDIRNLDNDIETLVEKYRKPRIKRWRVVAVAASVALLLGVGSFFFYNQNSKPDRPIALESKASSVSSSENKTEPAIVERTEHPDRLERIAQADMPKVSPGKPGSRLATSDIAPLIEQKEDASEVVLGAISPLAQNASREFSDSLSQNQLTANKHQALGGMSASQTSFNQLKGKVVDESGNPVVGARVKLGGTNLATVTDTAGNYQLKVPDLKHVGEITASYIGYESKTVSAEKALSIQLQPSQLALNEVTVVGYGVSKQKTLVGAVSRVKAKEQPAFGKKEFKHYFETHRQKELCEEKEAFVQFRFFIDESGTPTKLEIEKSNCAELNNEVLRLLKLSPKWTIRNQNVELEIRLK